MQWSSLEVVIAERISAHKTLPSVPPSASENHQLHTDTRYSKTRCTQRDNACLLDNFLKDIPFLIRNVMS